MAVGGVSQNNNWHVLPAAGSPRFEAAFKHDGAVKGLKAADLPRDGSVYTSPETYKKIMNGESVNAMVTKTTDEMRVLRPALTCLIACLGSGFGAEGMADLNDAAAGDWKQMSSMIKKYGNASAWNMFGARFHTYTIEEVPEKKEEKKVEEKQKIKLDTQKKIETHTETTARRFGGKILYRGERTMSLDKKESTGKGAPVTSSGGLDTTSAAALGASVGGFVSALGTNTKDRSRITGEHAKKYQDEVGALSAVVEQNPDTDVRAVVSDTTSHTHGGNEGLSAARALTMRRDSAYAAYQKLTPEQKKADSPEVKALIERYGLDVVGKELGIDPYELLTKGSDAKSTFGAPGKELTFGKILNDYDMVHDFHSPYKIKDPTTGKLFRGEQGEGTGKWLRSVNEKCNGESHCKLKIEERGEEGSVGGTHKHLETEDRSAFFYVKPDAKYIDGLGQDFDHDLGASQDLMKAEGTSDGLHASLTYLYQDVAAMDALGDDLKLNKEWLEKGVTQQVGLFTKKGASAEDRAFAYGQLVEMVGEKEAQRLIAEQAAKAGMPAPVFGDKSIAFEGQTLTLERDKGGKLASVGHPKGKVTVEPSSNENGRLGEVNGALAAVEAKSKDMRGKIDTFKKEQAAALKLPADSPILREPGGKPPFEPMQEDKRVAFEATAMSKALAEDLGETETALMPYFLDPDKVEFEPGSAEALHDTATLYRKELDETKKLIDKLPADSPERKALQAKVDGIPKGATHDETVAWAKANLPDGPGKTAVLKRLESDPTIAGREGVEKLMSDPKVSNEEKTALFGMLGLEKRVARIEYAAAKAPGDKEVADTSAKLDEGDKVAASAADSLSGSGPTAAKAPKAGSPEALLADADAAKAKGDYQGAAKLYQEAGKAAEKAGDKKSLAKAATGLVDVGHYFAGKGEHGMASVCYRQGAHLHALRGDEGKEDVGKIKARLETHYQETWKTDKEGAIHYARAATSVGELIAPPPPYSTDSSLMELDEGYKKAVEAGDYKKAAEMANLIERRAAWALQAGTPKEKELAGKMLGVTPDPTVKPIQTRFKEDAAKLYEKAAALPSPDKEEALHSIAQLYDEAGHASGTAAGLMGQQAGKGTQEIAKSLAQVAQQMFSKAAEIFAQAGSSWSPPVDYQRFGRLGEPFAEMAVDGTIANPFVPFDAGKTVAR